MPTFSASCFPFMPWAYLWRRMVAPRVRMIGVFMTTSYHMR
jgi:hypothetical protein